MDRSQLSYHSEQPQLISSVLLLIQTNMPLAHDQSPEQVFLTFWWFNWFECLLVRVWRVYAAFPFVYKLICCNYHYIKSIGVFPRWAFRSSICVFLLPPFPPCSVVKYVKIFLSVWWLRASSEAVTVPYLTCFGSGLCRDPSESLGTDEHFLHTLTVMQSWIAPLRWRLSQRSQTCHSFLH